MIVTHPFTIGMAVDIIGTNDPGTIVGWWADENGELYAILDLLIHGQLSGGKTVSRIVVPMDSLELIA